jgi:hypothetical protein
VADHETRGVHADGHVLGGSETSDSHVVVILVREHGPQIVRRREMDWVIKAWIRPHATLEATGTAIDFAQQLHLQPAVVALDHLSGRERTGKFRDTNEAYGRDKIYKTLRDADERPNLTDGLQATTVDWCYTGKIGIESHCYGGAKNVAHPSNAGRISLKHCRSQPRLRQALATPG